MTRALVAVGALAASLLLALPADAQPSARERWIRIRTEHFTVYSNASDNAALRIAKNLVQFRALLPRVTRSLRLDSAAPVNVYVFVDSASFAPYKRDEQLATSVSHRDGTYVALSAFPSAGRPGRLRRSYARYPLKDLYHEYTHVVLRNNFADPPLWLNEGLAELYATSSFYRKHAEVGRALPEYLALLRVSQWFPLRELITSRDTPEDKRARSIFLAQSWALVHYLAWNGPEAKARLDRALALADAGYSPSETFDAVFAPDAAELEAKLHAWVRRRSFRFVEIDTSDLSTPNLAVEPMSRAETLARLGDLLVEAHPGRAVEAEAHFRASLAEEPRFVAAWKGLGNALTAQARFADARDAFRRAIELDPSDARARSALAAILIFEIGHGADEARSVELLASARELYRGALALDPNSQDALAGLGATWALDPQPAQEGVDALERALELDPQQIHASCGLMALLLRMGETRRASEVATQTLRAGADPLLRHLSASAGALAFPAGIGPERRREQLRALVDLVEASIPAAISEASRQERIRARLRRILLAVSAAPEPAPPSSAQEGTR